MLAVGALHLAERWGLEARLGGAAHHHRGAGVRRAVAAALRRPAVLVRGDGWMKSRTGVLLGLLPCQQLYPGAEHRAEHKVVLHSVLPKAAIDRMRKEMDWKTINTNQAALQLVEIGACALGLTAGC